MNETSEAIGAPLGPQVDTHAEGEAAPVDFSGSAPKISSSSRASCAGATMSHSNKRWSNSAGRNDGWHRRPHRRSAADAVQGLKLLFANWRLTLVQVLPAMWIWAAMIDVKAHILHGRSFHVARGRSSFRS